MTHGLKESDINKINCLFEQYATIEQVIIYGSRAKGNFKYNSDIDLTIVGTDFTLSQLLRLENELDDLLLPYGLDLSIMAKIENQDLIKHIQRVGKIFYQKKDAITDDTKNLTKDETQTTHR